MSYLLLLLLVVAVEGKEVVHKFLLAFQAWSSMGNTNYVREFEVSKQAAAAAATEFCCLLCSI
jgi:hypothetical protein